ncbi:MAG: murein L,D-transpeptidase catalytic domain family protein, partial [Thermaurantiacus tibetensis]
MVPALQSISRRGLLGLAGALACLAPVRPLAASPMSGRDRLFVELAREVLARHGAQRPLGDRVGIADFALPSRAPRLFLVDLEAGRVSALLVSHGRGSDPGHTGVLQRFSNEAESHASSEGCFLTGAHYVGRHGRSMRLCGLEPSNSNAEARAIVVHAASYVSPAIARAQGKIGRSHGCFAVAPEDLDLVLTRLGPGRLLLSGRFLGAPG